MNDPELLTMLAAEAERRSPTIISGVEELATTGDKNSGRIEELRIEVHGLKGAALVVGQERLAELAKLIEKFLASCVDSGRINPTNAAAVVTATSAFTEGAQAAAEGVGEPSSVGDSMEALDR
jgi:HPt (histidine-containing phosphotransfer) domain-containing protein